jgi:hypothetical protein
MQNSIFSNITTCSSLEVNRRFGGTCRIFRVEEQAKLGSVCYLLHSNFLLGSFYGPEDGGDIFLRNIGLLSMDYTALYPRCQHSS